MVFGKVGNKSEGTGEVESHRVHPEGREHGASRPPGRSRCAHVYREPPRHFAPYLGRNLLLLHRDQRADPQERCHRPRG